MSETIRDRIRARGLELPAPMRLPPGVAVPFSWCKVLGRRVLLSGHVPLAADGSLWPICGKVGAEVSPEQGKEAARQATLSMLGTLERELGSLEPQESHSQSRAGGMKPVSGTSFRRG